ncbi:MAG: hypothetical protein IJC94_04580 [Oscillospiraceae bacterium]|nr:hypothetical protein [Oscillospiraceae bacterium]
MKEHKIIRYTGIVLGELLAVGTVIFLFAAKRYERLPLAFATLLIVLLPEVMERIFKCKLSLPFYVFALLYAVGPMMGQCWNFYYTISWWDKLLHICGGVMFAIVGAYFFELMVKQKNSFFATAVFALCFSVTIAAFWEFAEFGADQFLGMDMQDDTVINGITSYLLDEGIGVRGSLENIQSVTVDGIPLPVNGYIDIGLIDSMLDMMMESLGALITCIILLLNRGRHSLIRDNRNTKVTN